MLIVTPGGAASLAGTLITRFQFDVGGLHENDSIIALAAGERA